MKGYYVPISTAHRARHSTTFRCNHPLFSHATLFKIGSFGLLVIQKRFNSDLKVMFWGPIDPWLANDIFEEHGFLDVFDRLSGPEEDGLYPFIEVRKLMYELKMKPMKKRFWENY